MTKILAILFNPMFPEPLSPYLIRLIVAFPESAGSSGVLPIVVTLIGALGGALIGALTTLGVTWLTLHNQQERQRAEIRGQVELKGRELLFGAYQKKLEAFREVLKEQGELMAKFQLNLRASEDNETKKEVMATFLELVIDPEDYVDSIGELEKELKERGLLQKNEKHLAAIKANLLSDFTKVPSEDAEKTINGIVKALAKFNSLTHDLEDKRAEDLFSKFIN